MDPSGDKVSLTGFAPFPPSATRERLSSKDWSICVGAWSLLAHSYLRLSSNAFTAAVQRNESFVIFLTTYMEGMGRDVKDSNYLKASTHLELRRDVFLLVHRILSNVTQPPLALMDCTFLGDLSRIYGSSQSLAAVLEHIWRTRSPQIEESLQNKKDSLINSFSKGIFTPEDEALCTQRLIPLVRSQPAVGKFLTAGSDFMDSLAATYPSLPSPAKSTLLLLSYLSLLAPLRDAQPTVSIAIDQLYGLKASTEISTAGNDTFKVFLSDLVSDTPLLAKFKSFAATNDVARTEKILASLEEFQFPRSNKLRKPKSRNWEKANALLSERLGHGMHVHRMNLITQVQDLFPQIGSSLVAKLLDEYDDDVEQVTAYLLDDSLPGHLSDPEKTKSIEMDQSVTHRSYEHLVPQSSLPSLPQRRNAYDDDEFDRLAIEKSRVYLGRKDKDITADAILSNRSQAPNKAVILSALATFDSDDDERDDTYDLEDVGGTVDSALPGGGDDGNADDSNSNEHKLFGLFKTHPETFGRDAATRRSKVRQELKDVTGMTDEAIEGWAIVVSNDPGRLRRLERGFAAFSGEQRELISTAWRMPAESGTEDSEASSTEDLIQGYQGRGRGRGRGGGRRDRARGVNVAGPVSEKTTQVARDRKEVSKGSRANHNRRNQRARKMARGGFPE